MDMVMFSIGLSVGLKKEETFEQKLTGSRRVSHGDVAKNDISSRETARDIY